MDPKQIVRVVSYLQYADRRCVHCFRISHRQSECFENSYTISYFQSVRFGNDIIRRNTDLWHWFRQIYPVLCKEYFFLIHFWSFGNIRVTTGYADSVDVVTQKSIHSIKYLRSDSDDDGIIPHDWVYTAPTARFYAGLNVFK